MAGSDKWLRDRRAYNEFSFVGFRHLELYDAVLILQKGQQVSRIKLKFNMHNECHCIVVNYSHLTVCLHRLRFLGGEGSSSAQRKNYITHTHQ